MWKIIILVVAAFVLYKLFMGDRRKRAEQAKKEVEEQAQTGLMVKDPICGAYVSNESDIRVRDGSKLHCFCSYECRDAFIKRLEAGRSESEKA